MNKTIIIFLIIVIAGFSIRIYDLAENPLDFDESIHAFTSFLLFKEGIYNYEPATHGPFLYYITAGIFHVAGDNIMSARLLPAVFGGLMVLLLLPLRRFLGDVKFILISGMFAFSYSFIIFSRQIRHDIFIAFFILAFLACMVLFVERHSKSYLYLGFASLAITMAIKPTTYIFMFILVFFLILKKNIYFPSIVNYLKNNKIYSLIYIALIFIAINYLFYHDISAGFFKMAGTWIDMYKLDSNRNDFLFPPVYFYLLNLIKSEFLIFVTGLIGCVYYLSSKKENQFIDFCSFWALCSLLIFSIMAYKTPDLILNILLPFTIVSGFFLGDIIERFFYKDKLILKLTIIILLIISLYINSPIASSNINNEYEKITEFIKINKTDPENIYFLSPLGNFFGVQWPLPWYLREYNLFQIDSKGHVIELNYLFDEGYNAKKFVRNYEKKGIIITSQNVTYMEKLGYNNSKHFENSKFYIYY